MTDVFTSEELGRNKADALRAAKEAIAGPVPLIGEVPDTRLKLPRGLFHRGVWQTDTEVRELTGADEEILAKAKDQMAYFSTVLACGVVSIGDLDLSSLALAERKFYLNELLIGEREILFLRVIQASFGNEKVVGFTCTACLVEQEVTLLLSEDFKMKEVPEIDRAVFQFTTSKGDVLDYRPAVGADQEEALAKKGVSLPEQNTTMLARCITKRNGELIPDPVGYARSLGIKDRQDLLMKLVERQPSVDLDINTVCASCGADQEIQVGWGDLFRS